MHLVTGILSTTLVVSNLVVNFIALIVMGLVRVILKILRLTRMERVLARWMDGIINSWVGFNRFMFSALGLTRVSLELSGAEDLSLDRWYMVVSNHQTWTDILLLQTELHGRIPPLKFFTKRQLLWVPFLGQAMWLLDFPYVRRLSRAEIEANPELLQVDRNATLAACEKFKHHPVSCLNFLEGTRKTAEKYNAQQAPRFRNLLNPKTGGLTQVLSALDDRLHKLIDVTIEYPDGVPTFWEFMQGRCPRVTVRIDSREIPTDIRRAADEDARRAATTRWVEGLWQMKDSRLSASQPQGATA